MKKNAAKVRGSNFLRSEANEVSRNWFEGPCVFIYAVLKPRLLLSLSPETRDGTKRKARFAKCVRNFHVNVARRNAFTALPYLETITIHSPFSYSSSFLFTASAPSPSSFSFFVSSPHSPPDHPANELFIFISDALLNLRVNNVLRGI